MSFTESAVEDAALAWLAALGYAVPHVPGVPSGGRRKAEAAG